MCLSTVTIYFTKNPNYLNVKWYHTIQTKPFRIYHFQQLYIQDHISWYDKRGHLKQKTIVRWYKVSRSRMYNHHKFIQKTYDSVKHRRASNINFDYLFGISLFTSNYSSFRKTCRQYVTGLFMPCWFSEMHPKATIN